MSSIFTKILAGELPARFVWQDDDVAAFLSIAPLRPGHTLVVPRREVDQWTAADPALFAKCTAVAQTLGRAVQRAWDAPRVGLVVAGFEVPHLHLHVFPSWGMDDFDFARAEQHPDPAALDEAAEKIRTALHDLAP
jgi:diadenosine tetraphosphate (Ap4A) HIT family hydrolase